MHGVTPDQFPRDRRAVYLTSHIPRPVKWRTVATQTPRAHSRRTVVVDNICHTLVGAALAEAGLKRRTALGSATLMIAANFPDIDVIAVPLGHSLGFRRGITHGIPALLLLPV